MFRVHGLRVQGLGRPMVPRRDPLHGVVVGRVVLVVSPTPNRPDYHPLWFRVFSTPQTPLSRGAYLLISELNIDWQASNEEFKQFVANKQSDNPSKILSLGCEIVFRFLALDKKTECASKAVLFVYSRIPNSAGSLHERICC